mgnify:CR=1 FL=1
MTGLREALRAGWSGDGVTHVMPALRAARAVPPGARLLHLRTVPPVLAFSRRDALRPGFAAAEEVAAVHGFAPLVRHVGGSFAPLHEGSLVVDLYGTSPDASRGSVARFEESAAALRGLLVRLGLDARVGAVPGEYCPGEHSVNVAGRVKVAGIAQRVSGQAWLVSSVVQVHGAPALRAVTRAVAGALGAEVDPATVGDLASAGLDLDVEELASCVEEAFVEARLVRAGDVVVEVAGAPGR